MEGETPDGRRTYMVDAASGTGRLVGKVDFTAPWSPGGAWLATLDGLGRRVVFEQLQSEGSLAVGIEHAGRPTHLRWADPTTAVVVVEEVEPVAYVIHVEENRATIVATITLEAGTVVAGPNGEIAVIEERRALTYRPASGTGAVEVAASATWTTGRGSGRRTGCTSRSRTARTCWWWSPRPGASPGGLATPWRFAGRSTVLWPVGCGRAGRRARSPHRAGWRQRGCIVRPGSHSFGGRALVRRPRR